MIKKIKNIKDFGVFKNFNADSSLEFNTFNLIYGWNYSGKTTLSRVFRCLENGKLHDDYTSATFELENLSGEKYDNRFGLKPNVRVFNSDFIKENLKWDADSIEPIFLLGVENIELQEKLKLEETNLESNSKELEGYKKAKEEKQRLIEKAATDKARDIGNILSIRNFNKTNLIALVTQIGANVDNFKLNPIDFDKYKLQAIANEQKPNISEVSFAIPNVVTLKTEIECLLHRQAASSRKIQKLLDDKKTSDWVEAGKELHKEKTECEFCGNTLPLDLLVNLNEHFSKDYEQLKGDIEFKRQSLTTLKISLNKLPAETAFYLDTQTDFKASAAILDSEANSFNALISSFISDLEAKKEKPFDKLELTSVIDNSPSLHDALEKINKRIVANNERTAGFSAEKDLAIQKLQKHFASEFEINERYSMIQQELVVEQLAIEEKNSAIVAQKKNITAIKTLLNETIKGASKLNEYLNVFFGKDDIRIESTTDKKFKLSRGEEVAKNLSEGEKTAVAFAYFVAKLEEQNNQISESIVYIDDPISSLDSNHLFNR